MPSSLVATGQTVPRSRSRAVTAALTMAPPEASVTRPVSSALISWENSGWDRKSIHANSRLVILVGLCDCEANAEESQSQDMGPRMHKNKKSGCVSEECGHTACD